MSDAHRPSQELRALDGPVEVITRVEEELATLLGMHLEQLLAQMESALERRAAVKPELYPEDERARVLGALRIAASSTLAGFKRASRHVVGQGLLDAYAYHRYPKTVVVDPEEPR